MCQVELLGTTLGEPWPVLFDLVAEVTPGLIAVDGEEELSALCAERFPGVPRQRCLWHLARALVRLLHYEDRVSPQVVDQAGAEIDQLLRDAWATQNLADAVEALNALADTLGSRDGYAAAVHLRNAAGEIFTFLTNPDAGWLLTGHKGRPDVGTGVLERVMREMNRRSDIGARWSIPGIRAVLMTKLEHKYRHERWSDSRTIDNPTTVRISLQPPALPTAA